MAISQSLRNRVVVIEKEVTLAATSGTTEGISVPGGTYVIAAGFEPAEAVADVTTYTIDITDGTTIFANDLDLDAAAAGSIALGNDASGLVAADDTVDVVSTISGSPGTVTGRLFIVAIDVNENVLAPAEVVRDVLG